jgi:hypothetical protein
MVLVSMFVMIFLPCQSHSLVIFIMPFLFNISKQSSVPLIKKTSYGLQILHMKLSKFLFH